MPTPGHVLNPNKPATRFRGPLLVGAPAEMSQSAVNGVSTEPLISFWNAPEFGFIVNSSSKVQFYGVGAQLLAMTTDYVMVGGSSAMLTTATADTIPYLVIPQTTGILSSGDMPASLNGGVALVWARSSASDILGKLWAYSTSSTGWMASTTPFWSSTST